MNQVNEKSFALQKVFERHKNNHDLSTLYSETFIQPYNDKLFDFSEEGRINLSNL